MATLFLPDGSVTDVKPKGNRFTNEEICSITGIPHGYLEFVKVAPGSYLIVQENGKAQNPPLEMNHAATVVYRVGRGSADAIVGPALLVKYPGEINRWQN